MLMIPFTDYALYIWIQKKPSTLNALKVNWGGGGDTSESTITCSFNVLAVLFFNRFSMASKCMISADDDTRRVLPLTQCAH